ncbi:MAG: SIR2 family protein [Methanofollis sp.]|nr:SIR2 family protein [Methanofollis sp.]
MNGLISLLREQKGVLMVGAGSSAIVGYPLWKELIEELGNKFTPEPSETSSEDLVKDSDKIKENISQSGRLSEYYKFIDRIFQPRHDSDNFTDFHCTLLKLGFCGITTTNYDEVLEYAAGAAYEGEGYLRCDPIDLCDESKRYRVHEYLRSLSPDNPHNKILHLHGCHTNPQGIILTEEDYLKKYGMMNPDTSSTKGRTLDTLHRKVIWSLLVMHSLVFVGFSMDDPFFMNTLEIVQKDFSLDSDPVHFAIMGYSSDDERDEIERKLRSKGIQTVFYYAPKDENGIADHGGLQNLVFHLQALLKEEHPKPTERRVEKTESKKITKPPEVGFPSLDEINQKTLGLY